VEVGLGILLITLFKREEKENIKDIGIENIEEGEKVEGEVVEGVFFFSRSYLLIKGFYFFY
jgi:hypothetical protein